MSISLKRRTRGASEVDQDQARETAFRCGYESAVHDDPTQWSRYANTPLEGDYNAGYGIALRDLREGNVDERAPLVLLDYVGKHRVSA